MISLPSQVPDDRLTEPVEPEAGKPLGVPASERRSVQLYVMELCAGRSPVLVELVGQVPAGQLPVLIVASLLSLVVIVIVGFAPTVGREYAKAGDDRMAVVPTTATPPTPSFFSASRLSMCSTSPRLAMRSTRPDRTRTLCAGYHMDP